MKKLSTLIAGLLLAASSIAGTLPLRQATASQTVLIGPFIDTDGAPVTGLTIDAADVRISVNGGNIAGKNSGGCTHDELGMYACTFDATDTATVGRFQVTVSESGALIVTKDFVVLEEAVFDRDYAASATGYIANAPVNVAQIETADPTDTINAQVDAAIETYHLDHLFAATYDPASKPGAADALLNELIENDGGVARFTSNALEEAPSGGGGVPDEDLGLVADGITADGGDADSIELDLDIADDHLNGATVMIVSGTGAGQSRVISDWVNATNIATVSVSWATNPSSDSVVNVFGTAPGASSGSGATAQEVWEYSTRTLTALDEDSTTIDLNATAVGSVAGNVGGNVAGSVGSVTGNVGGTVNGLTATAQGNVRTAVGLSSANLDTQLGAIDDYLDTEIAAILTDTGTTLDTAIADLPTNSELAAALAGLLASQRIITGTCDSGSTTTCVDNALTQADASQLEDRLICFDDSWCALITTFDPSSDTATTTKTAPSTRASKDYTIFPATLE